MSNKPKPDLTKLTDMQIYERVKELVNEIEELDNAARQRGSIEIPEGEDTYFLDKVDFYNYWQPSRSWVSSNC